MKEDNLPDFINTKYIISQRCKKDHFNYVNDLPQKKQNSVYDAEVGINLKKHKKYKTINDISPRENVIIDIMDQSFEMKVKYKDLMSPLTSTYKNSYQMQNVEPINRAHEQESFFLKHDDYEPFDSTYKRMSLHIKDQNKGVYSLDKSQKHRDNLGVPKYNKFNTSSIYKTEFTGKTFTKLPVITRKSLHKESSLRESQNKIKKKVFRS